MPATTESMSQLELEADSARLEAELARLQARNAADPELREAVERARKEAESAVWAVWSSRRSCNVRNGPVSLTSLPRTLGIGRLARTAAEEEDARREEEARQLETKARKAEEAKAREAEEAKAREAEEAKAREAKEAKARKREEALQAGQSAALKLHARLQEELARLQARKAADPELCEAFVFVRNAKWTGANQVVPYWATWDGSIRRAPGMYLKRAAARLAYLCRARGIARFTPPSAAATEEEEARHEEELETKAREAEEAQARKAREAEEAKAWDEEREAEEAKEWVRKARLSYENVYRLQADNVRLEAEVSRLQARNADNPELCEAVERARKEAESVFPLFLTKKNSRGAAAPPRAKKPRLDDWTPSLSETIRAEDSASWNQEHFEDLSEEAGFLFVEDLARLDVSNIHDVRLVTGIGNNDAVAVGVATLWRDRASAYLDRAREDEGQIEPSGLPRRLRLDDPVTERTVSDLHPIIDLFPSGAGDSMGVRGDDDRDDLCTRLPRERTQITAAQKVGKRRRRLYSEKGRSRDLADDFEAEVEKLDDAASRHARALGLGS